MSKLQVSILCIFSAVFSFALAFGLTQVHWDQATPSLVVTGPQSVNAGDEIVLTAKVQNPSWFLSKTIYQWKVLNHTGELPYHTISENNIFLPAGLAKDKFYAVCSATNYHNYVLWGSANPLDIKVVPITVGDPGPTPGPTPPPPPPPPPVPPVTDQLYVISIFDNTVATNLSPSQLAIHNSTTISPSLKALNAVWKNYDKANPALADPTWQAAINKVQLPAYFITDVKGKSYANTNIGVDAKESDIVNAVSKIRGK